MSRKNFNDGQEVIFQDLQALQALAGREIYDRVVYELLQRVGTGVFQDSFIVSYVGAALVSVNQGVGFQRDLTQVSPEPVQRMLYLASSGNQALAPADTSNDRIDKICIRAARADTLTENRLYKATLSSTPATTPLVTETDWLSEVLVVTGTPSGSPAVPATPSGYIALASVLVHAVTGVTGAGDITDLRAKLPIGGDVVLNTLGLQRLTAGAAVPLTTLISNIDTLLKFGYLNYTDFDDLGSSPAAPSAGKVRVYVKNNVLTFRDSAGAETLAGGGGGGGGGANWNGTEGTSPVDDTENGEKVWLYSALDAGTQKLTLFVKVPDTYVPGKQIILNIGIYSPSASGTILLQSVSYLVRQNLDAITTLANALGSGNTALTNTVANQYRKAVLPLTSSIGQINGFAVNPGDLLKVVLSRGTDTDTADIRFVPSITEVKFS